MNVYIITHILIHHKESLTQPNLYAKISDYGYYLIKNLAKITKVIKTIHSSNYLSIIHKEESNSIKDESFDVSRTFGHCGSGIYDKCM